jgi:putative flippase GtrA
VGGTNEFVMNSQTFRKKSSKRGASEAVGRIVKWDFFSSLFQLLNFSSPFTACSSADNNSCSARIARVMYIKIVNFKLLLSHHSLSVVLVVVADDEDKSERERFELFF